LSSLQILPVKGTRHYHDRFNLSANPLFAPGRGPCCSGAAITPKAQPPTAQHRAAPHRVKLGAAAALLTALLIWIVFATRRGHGFDVAAFLATFGRLDPWWLAACVLFSYATYVVRAFRWAVLLRPLRPKPRFWGLFTANMIGFTAVVALGRAGELVRPWLIANKEDVPFASQVAAWVVERLYDSLVAMAAFGFALFWLQNKGFEGRSGLGPGLTWALQAGGFVIGLLSAACLAVLLAMAYQGARIQSWILRALRFLSAHRLNSVERVIESFLDGVRCTQSQSATVRLIAYTALEWLLVAACYACVLRAFGDVVPISLTNVLILMGFVTFGSIVQLPGVGGGAQVTAMLVLTEIFSVPIEVATSLALVLWLAVFLAVVPAGALLALHEGITWARLREAEASSGSAGFGVPEEFRGPEGFL
jgi:uncharacterized protein (TIRG00374 family)